MGGNKPHGEEQRSLAQDATVYIEEKAQGFVKHGKL